MQQRGLVRLRVFGHGVAMRRREFFASHVSLYGRMGYALPFTHRRSGGHHRKEEAEAGQEQEERRRSVLTVRRHAQSGQTRHLVHEPIRQEALAGDHRARPQRAPYHFGDDRRQREAAYFGIRPEDSRTIKRVFLFSRLNLTLTFGGLARAPSAECGLCLLTKFGLA